MSAEAARERAEALLAQKQATARRRRELANRGSGSIEAAEQAETEVATAIADLALDRADAAVAVAAIADARANLLAERTTLAKHRLLAPFAGTVIARHREPQSPLNPGEAVFTLVAPETIWALVHVDEGRAGAIRLGQPAVVRMRSRPGEPVAAEVVRIGLESDRVCRAAARGRARDGGHLPGAGGRGAGADPQPQGGAPGGGGRHARPLRRGEPHPRRRARDGRARARRGRGRRDHTSNGGDGGAGPDHPRPSVRLRARAARRAVEHCRRQKPRRRPVRDGRRPARGPRRRRNRPFGR